MNFFHACRSPLIPVIPHSALLGTPKPSEGSRTGPYSQLCKFKHCNTLQHTLKHYFFPLPSIKRARTALVLKSVESVQSVAQQNFHLTKNNAALEDRIRRAPGVRGSGLWSLPPPLRQPPLAKGKLCCAASIQRKPVPRTSQANNCGKNRN